MKKRSLVLFCLLFITISIIPVYANAAELPSITIIVEGKDAEVIVDFLNDGKVIEDDGYGNISKRSLFNETYFVFYDDRTDTDTTISIRVTTPTETYEIETDSATTNYYTIYRLDQEKQLLEEGKGLKRSLVLVSTRVFITLVVEGLILYLFGFREKRTWIIFLVVNLLTQGGLNIWMNTSHMFESYLFLNLIFTEIFILIAEIMLLIPNIKEKKSNRVLAFVFTANFFSLIVGIKLIAVLPV